MELAEDPAHGPGVLFFSGGTALREACSELIKYTWNSVHIVTPFDSGGSSAVLREEFDMPSMGDARNRVLALADKSDPQVGKLVSLLSKRLVKGEACPNMKAIVESLAKGRHPLLEELDETHAQVVSQTLQFFLTQCSSDFDYENACIGNLVLVALYLKHDRRSAPAIDELSRLVKARGIVRLVLDEPLDLLAELEDGRSIHYQHRITGKEVAPLNTRIRRLRFLRSGTPVPRRETRIDAEVRQLISNASLICYPVGSFFTSIIANLLVGGVSDAIAANGCPKVFTPNLGLDPELFGMTLSDEVDVLLGVLKKGGIVKAGGSYLDALVVDPEAFYPGEIDFDRFESLGLEVLEAPHLDKELGLAASVGLVDAVVSLSC